MLDNKFSKDERKLVYQTYFDWGQHMADTLITHIIGKHREKSQTHEQTPS